MKKEGYYSSGQFAKLADVSVRTIRFYDRQNVLKPSFVDAHGARFYTDRDLASLQQILLLKYLGFSLEEIRDMTIGGSDYSHISRMLRIQEKLVQDRIEQMQTVAEAIRDTEEELRRGNVNWQNMLDLIHLTGMERSLASQYRSATNLSARIALHSLYSTNPEGWFPWLYRKLELAPGMRVLEVGCGDGALWTCRHEELPRPISIVLSDISDGMIRDVRRNIRQDLQSFTFQVFDCANIPYADNTFDLVIANHVLFYADDLPGTLQELARVLRPGGRFICSSYSSRHMHEIRDLVRLFDSHISLSLGHLYERFGLENGQSLLSPVFSSVRLLRYEDGLRITDPQPLIEYILSCHGNQNQYLVNRYKEFQSFVKEQVGNEFYVTKDAGIFVCRL
ncbi:MerR family transcriptional regulator [Porcincola intestinalis]|uniref:Methyltransferase domain-containing protein n=1 Tax=Porcincola intestinalis TaxID=2606632 RepID=A0A6L5X1E5_9FIRM|nr:methyltransferase domain-containing protein [Porcincola intestinalis]MSS14219.1 methyltransferase domain-containing protein [Porcincola intestinalis]